MHLVVAAAGYGKTTAARAEAAGRTWISGAEIESWIEAGEFKDDTVFDNVPRLSATSAQRLIESAAGRPITIITRYCLPAPAAVGPAELALSQHRVAELLAAEYGLAQAEAADELYAATLGWPALVRLGAESWLATGTVVASPGTPLERFLVEEVLAELPAPQLRLLREVCEVDPVSAELCRALGLGDDKFLKTLGLVREERVVPLVAEVIRQRLSQADPGRTARIALAWYGRHGPPVAAVRAAVKAGDRPATVSLLHHHGDALVAGGHAASIVDIIRDLLDDGDDRRLRLLLGDALRTQGAVLAAAEAYAAVTPVDGPDPELAWRLGLVHYLRGQSPAALAAFETAVAEKADGEIQADGAILLAWKAAAHLQAGHADMAESVAREALTLAQHTGHRGAVATAQVSLALCLAMSGDESGAADLQEAAFQIAVETGDLVMQARILTNQTYDLLVRAAYGEALEKARKAVDCAVAAGHTNMRMMASGNQADALVMLGRYDEAVTEYERVLALGRGMGSRRTAGAHLGLGEVYRRRGWTELARGEYEAAIRGAEEGGNNQVLVSAFSGLARTLSTVDVQAAAEAADRAVSQAAPHVMATALLARGWVAAQGTRPSPSDTAARESGRAVSSAVMPGDTAARESGRAVSSAVMPGGAAARESGAAAMRNHGGAWPEAGGPVALAREARRHARETGDLASLADSLELEAVAAGRGEAQRALLREAEAIWTKAGAVMDVARVRCLLGDMPKAATDERLAALLSAETLTRAGVPVEPTRAGQPVAIQTFGQLTVFVGTQQVPTSHWQSRKARDLLRILVARRGRPVPRGELCEMMWPDDDAGKTAHRLRVLLTIVRSAFDPDRTVPPDHFVVSDNASIGLDVSRLRVDVEEFLADVAHGRRLRDRGATADAVRLLTAADERYAADVFADEPYADWAEALREEARAAHLTVLRMLSQATRALGDAGASISYLLRLLAADPYDEPAHRSLVDILVADGRHGEAQRAHSRYRHAMRSIGVHPTPLLLSTTSR